MIQRFKDDDVLSNETFSKSVKEEDRERVITLCTIPKSTINALHSNLKSIILDDLHQLH